MSISGPPYTTVFRQRMIELIESGRAPTQRASAFGVTAQTISNRFAQAAIDERRPLTGEGGLSSAERRDLDRLRRDNRRFQNERDSLAKATT
jgi:transposase